jgi:hypothetical protein
VPERHVADLEVKARWIVPVESRDTVLEDHAVLVSGGLTERARRWAPRVLAAAAAIAGQ